jgi:nitrate reductase beta subunit
VALPLHPEYGTEPNVYYIPPWSPRAYAADGSITDEMRIPTELLEGLFGPEVKRVLATLDAERQKKMNKQESELMDILISRDWHSMFGGFTEDPLIQARMGGKSKG